MRQDRRGGMTQVVFGSGRGHPTISSDEKPECSYNKLMIVWDETKRRMNLEKHGLDFADADLVYENPGKITFQSPRKGEARKQDIAMVAARDRVLTLIYVERGTDVQVISFRVASRVEREVYEQTQKSD
jgi:uncharacterized protein